MLRKLEENSKHTQRELSREIEENLGKVNYCIKKMSEKGWVKLKLLRKLEGSSKYTQRELSREMGVSLGLINYCMRNLTEKGWVKIVNFSRNPNKVGYLYILTPKGIEEKARLTIEFLRVKIEEYEILKEEIGRLREDAEQLKVPKKDSRFYD